METRCVVDFHHSTQPTSIWTFIIELMLFIHTFGCTFEGLIELHKLSEGELRRHQPEKNRGQRSINSLSFSKGRDALYNTPIHNQFLREKSFFGIEKHLEWSTQLWSNVLFIYHLFTAPFTALNAHRVSLFCGVGVTEVLEPSILKTDECGSVIR